MNMGAGHVAYQDLTRIDRFVREGGFRQRRPAIDHGALPPGRTTRCTCSGLVSDGGVHGHIRHLNALWRWPAESASEPSRARHHRRS